MRGAGGRGSARPASAHPRTRYSPTESRGGRERGWEGDGEGEGKIVGSAAGLTGSALESKTGGRDYGAALAGSPKRDVGSDRSGRGGGSSGGGDSDCGGGGVLGETGDSQAFPERGPGLPPATVAGAKRGPGLPPATVASGSISVPPLPLAVEPQRPPVALAPPQASVEPIVASSSSSSSVTASVAASAAASGESVTSQIQAEMRDMLIFMRRSQEQQAEAMRRHIDHIESRMQVRDACIEARQVRHCACVGCSTSSVRCFVDDAAIRIVGCRRMLGCVLSLLGCVYVCTHSLIAPTAICNRRRHRGVVDFVLACCSY